MKLHFSIDDVFGAFRWLTKTDAESIYESFVFNTVKKIHKKYGIEITLYCMYKVGDYCLEDIPNKWIDEFVESSSWLKFGFHSYTDMSEYSRTSGNVIAEEYSKTITQLERITGGRNLANIIRLHYFSGNIEVLKALRKEGVQGFLCADDNRICYGLNKEENNMIRQEGHIYDECLKLDFYHTDFRLEHLENGYENVIREKIRKQNQLVFFTHEPFLENENIYRKIENIFNIILEEDAEIEGI